MDQEECSYQSKGKEIIVPAYKVDAIDTTGAGDAFNGGLLAALSERKELWEAVRFANGLAALSVQRLGTTPAMRQEKRLINSLQNTNKKEFTNKGGRKMLKGIPEIIGSDLLKALADMGHGDILVVADHFIRRIQITKCSSIQAKATQHRK